ncbi:MAG TPA: hypothetical protein VE548_05270 [Nitrososphaeraceae archaeon]|jgi:hypothetical protein|nr:hypothetical protein [Nitrososphaeraceae archaeon]
MRHKLSPPARSRILKSALDYLSSNYHKSETEVEYFELMTEKKIVVCYKCKIEIEIGAEYENSRKYGKSNSRKYYHPACYLPRYH